MKLSEISKNYIFTTRVEFGEDFVELREPTQAEIVAIRKEKDEDSRMIDALEKIFTKCLIAHSFEKEDGKTASNDEVYNELKKSCTLFSDILTNWLESIPFNSRTVKHGK